MEELVKSISGFIIGIAVLIGSIFLAIFFIKGGVWLGARVLPWLSFVMWFVLALDILIILPFGIFNKTKAAAAVGLVVSSYVYGITLWFWALLLTYMIWGTLAVLIGLFIAGVGIVPVALLATVLKGEWAIIVQLVLLVIFTFGSRTLGFYFAQRADEIAYKSSYAE